MNLSVACFWQVVAEGLSSPKALHLIETSNSKNGEIETGPLAFTTLGRMAFQANGTESRQRSKTGKRFCSKTSSHLRPRYGEHFVVAVVSLACSRGTRHRNMGADIHHETFSPLPSLSAAQFPSKLNSGTRWPRKNLEVEKP